MEFCGTELTLPFTSQLAWKAAVRGAKKSWIGSTSGDWIPKKKQHRQVEVCSGSQFQTHSLSRWGGGMAAAQGASRWLHCSCSQNTGRRRNASAQLSFSLASTLTPTAWDDVSHIQGGSPSSANPFLETPSETHPEGCFQGDPKPYQLDSEDEQSQVPCCL